MSEYREAGALGSQVEVRTPSKEEVLAIYRRAWGREASPNFNPDNFRIVQCGRKELLLSLGYDQGSTLLVARPEEEIGESLPGETTAAYEEVKKLMEEHARALPVPYTYTLTTENEKMRQWAQAKGNEVFGWDQVIEPSTFVKYFPSSRS